MMAYKTTGSLLCFLIIISRGTDLLMRRFHIKYLCAELRAENYAKVLQQKNSRRFPLAKINNFRVIAKYRFWGGN